MKKLTAMLLSLLMLFTGVSLTFAAYAAETPVWDYYSKKGAHAVSTLTYTVDGNDFTYKAWYPADIAKMEKCPVILYCNGTGSNYEQESAAGTVACHEKAASFGYIVVNNTDTNCGTGASMDAGFTKLRALNKDSTSVFYGKVDLGRVVLAGHSQGATCTMNMANAEQYANAKYYKAIFAASLPNKDLAASDVQNCPYDTKKVKTPTLLIAGVHWQELAIAPMNSLTENFKNINADTYLARIKDTPHTDSFEKTFPYMLAWFDYRLNGKKLAAEAFTGKYPELDRNADWQDFDAKIKKRTCTAKSVKAGKKSFKFVWKKDPLVTGYQVQYALNKGFTKSRKTVKVSGTSKTVKKLKAGKRYYVRVRSYITVGNKNYYSKWSAVKSVKPKK